MLYRRQREAGGFCEHCFLAFFLNSETFMTLLHCPFGMALLKKKWKLTGQVALQYKILPNFFTLRGDLANSSRNNFEVFTRASMAMQYAEERFFACFARQIPRQRGRELRRGFQRSLSKRKYLILAFPSTCTEWKISFRSSNVSSFVSWRSPMEIILVTRLEAFTYRKKWMQHKVHPTTPVSSKLDYLHKTSSLLYSFFSMSKDFR